MHKPIENKKKGMPALSAEVQILYPSNNDISNCQGLCPNCHSLKTEDDRRRQ